MTVTSLILGVCAHCGKGCDKASACCFDCRWERQRASQGPLRFWSKVNPDRDCWLWTGYLMKKDYGQFRGFDGRTILAHRMAWILTYGPIEDDLCVLHTCDEPRCVRPDHLFLGTRAENNADMIAKGRRNEDYRISRLPRGDDWKRRHAA